MIQQVISQSSIDQPEFNQVTMPEIIQRTGFYSEVSNTSVFYQGKTFTTGITPYTVNNNQAYIYEIQGNSVTFDTVGDGTTTPDVFDHPRPALHIDNSGFIWFLQIDPHEAPIDVYKSNSSGTISGGFTFQGQINIDASYMNLYELDDTNIKLITRTANVYGHRSISVDLTNLAGATSYDITNPNFSTTNVRHYHSITNHYGVSTRRWFVINHSQEPPIRIYKSSAYWWELDTPNVIYNPANTYSKDITVQITETELENNGFAINGSNANNTLSNISTLGLQVNDDFYGSDRVSQDVWRIIRVDSTNTITYSAVIETKLDSSLMSMVYNGQNIVMQVKKDSQVYVYAVSLDLSTIVLKRIFNVPSNRLLDFPTNYDKITGNYAAIIRDDASTVFNWINLSDRFFL